ncbi:unnamed protein product, partial [Heterosigma akashiwo]
MKTFACLRLSRVRVCPGQGPEHQTQFRPRRAGALRAAVPPGPGRVRGGLQGPARAHAHPGGPEGDQRAGRGEAAADGPASSALYSNLVSLRARQDAPHL